ncbi:uncharacterized protein LOC127242363 [Andrographis paniculata]|uniref:uncharacterized protein LOC127242363 n=1 Tax=Andrographis paniculata TaxID=175694 RepID=UPI0021E836CC|nr:uncharacterized protein LOC127242363 [Andrographis paniculata]
MPKISWSWFVGKDKEKVSNGSSAASKNLGVEIGEESKNRSENTKLSSNRRKSSSSLSGKSKREWKSNGESSRGNRIVDKECDDMVLVPSDGESSDSDWSIGWLEPHGPNFENDDSFAVLVPCYRHGVPRKGEDPSVGVLMDVEKLGNDDWDGDGITEYMERWLSSLRKY